MNRIKTRVAEFTYLEEERILYVKILEGSDIELADSIENFQATLHLTKGKKYLKLVDTRPTYTATKEVREFAAKNKEHDGRIAEALLVRSTASQLLANFYINFNKPTIPTKMFSSESKALEWLQSFLYLTETQEELVKKER